MLDMQRALQAQLSIDNVLLQRDTYLYKRSFRKISRRALREAEKQWHWFALTPGYGSDETYGPIVSTWRIKVDMRLLDISTSQKRRVLTRLYAISHEDLQCDQQYSGGSGNLDAHNALEPIVVDGALDGTYISDDVADDECSGPSEVVLHQNSLHKLSKM